MKDILQVVHEIMIKTANYQDDISKKFGLNPDDPPVGAFGMINNHSLITFELLDHYYLVWTGQRNVPIVQLSEKPSTIEEMKRENAERITEISKSLMIQTMSSIEFILKQTIKKYPSHPISDQVEKKKNNMRIYLRDIIEVSKKIDFIDSSNFNAWIGLIEIRNMLVHNNGIADCDAEYIIGGIKIKFQKDKMTQGTLKLFPTITLEAVEKYRDWTIIFLESLTKKEYKASDARS